MPTCRTRPVVLYPGADSGEEGAGRNTDLSADRSKDFEGKDARIVGWEIDKIYRGKNRQYL